MHLKEVRLGSSKSFWPGKCVDFRVEANGSDWSYLSPGQGRTVLTCDRSFHNALTRLLLITEINVKAYVWEEGVRRNRWVPPLPVSNSRHRGERAEKRMGGGMEIMIEWENEWMDMEEG